MQSLTGPSLPTSNLSAAGFVNPAAGDFHLQATSPAVGAGVNLSGVTWGRSRGRLRLEAQKEVVIHLKTVPPTRFSSEPWIRPP